MNLSLQMVILWRVHWLFDNLSEDNWVIFCNYKSIPLPNLNDILYSTLFLWYDWIIFVRDLCSVFSINATGLGHKKAKKRYLNTLWFHSVNWLFPQLIHDSSHSRSINHQFKVSALSWLLLDIAFLGHSNLPNDFNCLHLKPLLMEHSKFKS